MESGFIDLSVEDMWPPHLSVGERVLVMAAPQTLYAPVGEHGIDALADYPAYSDLLVPTVYGSLYYTVRLMFPEDAMEWASTRNQDDIPWMPPADEVEKWADLVDVVRVAASSCSNCGSTVSGALLEAGDE